MAASARRGLSLSAEQAQALEHVTGNEGLASVVGYAGSGKSAMLGVAREAWEAEGFTVRGAALSGIAAENLEGGSGIASRTLASLEHQWEQGRDHLTGRDVLVIDEAGMIGSRQMERVLSTPARPGPRWCWWATPSSCRRSRRAPPSAPSPSATARWRSPRCAASARTGSATPPTTWRPGAPARRWTLTTPAARCTPPRPARQARRELVERWDRERQAEPDATRIILTHTNAEVRELNELARGRLRDAGALGEDVVVQVDRGERTFAPGDRVMFLKNERSLGVKNGTLGVLEQASPERLAVRLDDGRRVAFDLKDYAHLDHGYAATVHKAQGVTVDRAHVLATPGMDRHAAYVAMSRHRDRLDLHYAREDFADRDSLVRTLSRNRAKDMASDYADTFAGRRGWERPGRKATPSPEPVRDPEQEQRLAGRAAFQRHARAVATMFQAQEGGRPLAELDQRGQLADKAEELRQARRGLDALDPHYSRDIERAYRTNPALAHEAAGGTIRRAVQAMRLEEELRVTAPARAEAFVDRWRDLDARRQAAYQAGDMSGMRGVRNSMGEMAKSLERDPQLESILAAQKSAQLGIEGFAPEHNLTRQLAMSIGFDLGRGRGLGL